MELIARATTVSEMVVINGPEVTSEEVQMENAGEEEVVAVDIAAGVTSEEKMEKMKTDSS